MTSFVLPCPARLRCSGVILHHHKRWWFVESPQPDGSLAAIHGLTGHLTPAMVDRLNTDHADRNILCHVGDPYPLDLYWSGAFCLIPSDKSPDLFEIETCIRCSEADISDVRRARVTIESTLFPLPPRFVSVLALAPKEDRPVLAIRLSGYMCATFELLTARYMPTYRPKSPWRDISNDAVGDSGSDILGWRYADDWIMPA